MRDEGNGRQRLWKPLRPVTLYTIDVRCARPVSLMGVKRTQRSCRSLLGLALVLAEAWRRQRSACARAQKPIDTPRILRLPDWEGTPHLPFVRLVRYRDCGRLCSHAGAWVDGARLATTRASALVRTRWWLLCALPGARGGLLRLDLQCRSSRSGQERRRSMLLLAFQQATMVRRAVLFSR